MTVEFDPDKLAQLRALSEELFPKASYLEECIATLFDKFFGDRTVTNWKPGQVFFGVLRKAQDTSVFGSSSRYLLEVFHYEKNTPFLTLVLGEAGGVVGVASVGFDPRQHAYRDYPEHIAPVLQFVKGVAYRDDDFCIIVPSPQGGYCLAEHCA